MNTSLAERLKYVRGQIPQTEFAALIGIHKSSWGRFERGDSEPSSSDLEKICSIYGINPTWLLLGCGEPKIKEPSNRPTSPPENMLQVPCARCAKLEAELGEERKERRDLATENRQLWKENGQLRERAARLEEAARKPGIFDERSAHTGAA